MKLAGTFRSLKYPNYRLYFIGQTTSLIGTWMQRMAVSWLVYRLTHSAYMLGIVGFAGLVPTFILSPYGGVLSDRYDRFKILFITQVMAMIQAGVLAAMVLSGHYTITGIIILSVFLGIINAFDTPSRQSLLVVLIDDKKDLTNAIALNSSMVNLARLIGPTIAGLILAYYGEGICFLLNAVSFIAVITCLLRMKLIKQQYVKPTKKVWEDFSEGFSYLRKSVPLRRIILMMGLISLLLMPYTTLTPIFAKDIFKGDAKVFGLLNAVSGLGALVSAFSLATLKSTRLLPRIILAATFIFSIAIIAFSYTNYLSVATAFMVIVGSGMMLSIAVGNTLVQSIVTDQMRGRVMSFYTMAFFGMLPFGNFLVGFVAEHIGARHTLALQGICGLIIGAVFFPYLRKLKLAASE